MREGLDKLEQFFAHSKRIYYKKGDLIIRAEDTPSGVYYLTKGYVKVYALSETGQELTLIIFKPGDIFPMIWTFTDTPNAQYYEALTPIEISRAPKVEFLNFLDKNPDVLRDVLKRILTRMNGLVERMEYMVFGNAYQKIASILCICAERFGVKHGKEIVIRVPLTHKDIANLVGLTRETTSLELKKIEKKNICTKEGRFFTVKNLPKLRNEAKWNPSP